MVVYIYYITVVGLAAGQLLPGQPVRYEKGRRYGSFITYKITPAGSLSPPASQPGGQPCWARLLAFGLIDYIFLQLVFTFLPPSLKMKYNVHISLMTFKNTITIKHRVRSLMGLTLFAPCLGTSH
jgi:hypothetical protein